jgi:hypothetical protein
MTSADIVTSSSSTTELLQLEKPSSVIFDSSKASKRKRSSDFLPVDMPAMISPEKGTFNPGKHLDFILPSKVFTMKELGFPENTGVSPVAVSEPFKLFTPEAVQRMRAEVLSTQIWENCQYSSNLSQCQLRGFAQE